MRTVAPRSLLAGTLVLGVLVAADLPEGNLARLASMSREQRAVLAENLDTFEALDASEKTAILDIHSRLSALDPATRARYLGVLRRYEVFRQGLPEAKREALDSETDPARKLSLIASYRAEQRADAEDESVYADALQVSDLGGIPLRMLERELVVWFNLDPVQDAKDRHDFERLDDTQERRAMAIALIRKKGLRAKLREVDGEFLVPKGARTQDEQALAGDQAKAEFSKRKGGLAGGGALADLTEKGFRSALMKLDEIRVLHQHDEDKVSSANLARFEDDLPSWARESLDQLPPDAARRRLTVLYRLIFPAGSEMPAPKPREVKKADPPRLPRPSGGNNTPF